MNQTLVISMDDKSPNYYTVFSGEKFYSGLCRDEVLYVIAEALVKKCSSEGIFNTDHLNLPHTPSDDFGHERKTMYDKAVADLRKEYGDKPCLT